MGTEDFDLVLFDLGGVLVRLGGVAAMRQLAGIDSDDEVWVRWLACRWVRDFERGHCSDDDFAAGVIADWNLPIAPADFLELFAAWPEGLYHGATELVDAVRERLPVGCLSNTNSIHWELQASRYGFDELFDHQFLSYQVGLVKPDREIFDYAIQQTGCSGDRIVFLDDNAVNVESAHSAGLEAYQVRGVEEAQAALTALGLIAPTRS